MVDLYTYDLFDAMSQPGCPMCRALVLAEIRWVDSFWREGKADAGSRRRFYAAGGFCRRHAWLLRDRVAEAAAGAAIADVYGALARRDGDWLGDLAEIRGGKQRPHWVLRREGRCPACREHGASLARKAHFLAEALETQPERRRYEASSGLCFDHLAAVVERATPSTALFLVDDWRRRLADVAAALAEFDRKRDHRFAHEQKGAEQHSWTDVIRLYAGERNGG